MLTYKIIGFDQNIGQIHVVVNEYDFGIIPINLVPDSEGKYPTGEALHNYIIGFLPEHELERIEKVKLATNTSEIQQLVQPLPEPEPAPAAAPTEQIYVM